MKRDEILAAIPQRDPFLFVDKVIQRDENTIHTQKLLTGEEDFFKGHFPGNPIMPGVLLCEAVFQSGALLMAGRETEESSHKLAVVSRIQNSKFKKLVRPKDLLDIEVKLKEHLANAYYMKGKITVDGKVALIIEFACTLTE